MDNCDVDEKKLKNGEYCLKGIPGCFCKVGWPYERQCSECRDSWGDNFRDSFCICPPEDEEKIDEKK